MDRLCPLLLVFSVLLPTSSLATPLDKRAAVNTCLTDQDVPVYASGTSEYNQAIRPFNIRVPFSPAAWVVPRSVADIQKAVKCGADNSVHVSAKSGGHSYGSHGLGGEDGHVVIDLRNFNGVKVDEASSTANIGTGGRLGNIALALYDQGKQAISHGTCPAVGVGGLTLHGGYGMISRLKGLTLDNLVSANVVLADGTQVTASEKENSDLFWALRGAGASYGIATNFTFKTFPAPDNNIVFNYNVQPSSAAQLSTMVTALQDFSKNTQPKELTTRLYISFQTTLSGVYFGSREDFNKTITPLLAKMGVTVTGKEGNYTWPNTLLQFSNGPLQQPTVYDQHETFFAKSLMATLSPAAIDALSAYWYANARSMRRGWYLMIDTHSGSYSAISSVDPDATAYAHRNATLKMQFYDVAFGGSYDPSWTSFLNGWVKAIVDANPGDSNGMYVNYADTSLSKDEAHQRYWPGHYNRLAEIKKKYDPKNVFGGPQLVGS